MNIHIMLQGISLHMSLTELQTHFGPASECEGAEKEDEVDEEEVEFGPVLAPQADDPAPTADPTHSAASTLNSTHSKEHQRSHHPLGAQLGRLKQETNRYTPKHPHTDVTTHSVKDLSIKQLSSAIQRFQHILHNTCCRHIV